MKTMLGVLSLIISVLALIVAYKNIGISTVDPATAMSVVGMVVTAIAFVVGIYFVAIAVNAFYHLRDVESIHEECLGAGKDIASKTNEINSLLKESEGKIISLERNMASSLDEFLGFQLSIRQVLADSGPLAEEIRPVLVRYMDNVYRMRCLLAIRSRNMEPERRKILVREASILEPDEVLVRELRKLVAENEDTNCKASATAVLTSWNMSQI